MALAVKAFILIKKKEEFYDFINIFSDRYSGPNYYRCSGIFKFVLVAAYSCDSISIIHV